MAPGRATHHVTPSMNVVLPSGGDSVGIGVTDSAFSCGAKRPATAEALQRLKPNEGGSVSVNRITSFFFA